MTLFWKLNKWIIHKFFLEECKYKIKKIKMSRLINTELESESESELESDLESDSDCK